MNTTTTASSQITGFEDLLNITDISKVFPDTSSKTGISLDTLNKKQTEKNVVKRRKKI